MTSNPSGGVRSPRSASESAPTPLISVENLSVRFNTESGPVEVISDVSFDIAEGSTVGLVGESGSGKTVTALSILGLLPRNGSVVSGTVRFGYRDLLGLPPAELRKVRGREIAMIFQEPMTSLNPAFTVGDQIAETVRLHEHVGRKQAWDRAVEVLDAVHVPNARERVHDYPHRFSGGMRQRVMIAMALACSPRLLIADEPTTALDVTVQARVLELLKEVQERFGMAVLLVTHDLGVVADVCDDVVVMYAGQVVEHSATLELFERPLHPYTEGLLSSMPQGDGAAGPLRFIPGRIPAPQEFPASCRFYGRCTHARDTQCNSAAVPLDLTGRRLVRCVRWQDLDLGRTI